MTDADINDAIASRVTVFGRKYLAESLDTIERMTSVAVFSAHTGDNVGVGTAGSVRTILMAARAAFEASLNAEIARLTDGRVVPFVARQSVTEG